MMSSSQTEKIVDRCRNCNRYAAAPDNFCRWCGFHQSDAPFSTPGLKWQTTKTTVLGPSEQGQSNNTTVLGDREEAPRLVSRLPLDSLSQSVADKTGSLRLNRYGAAVIAVLIAIPMWLLIVLLSPFDAYLSAKAACSQMNVR